MWIKVIRGALHLGLAYRGDGKIREVPDAIAKKLIAYNCAVPVPAPKKEVKEVEVEPEVKTAVIKNTRKRPVKKKDEV